MTRFLRALLVVLTASACTPAMQDAWRAMSPAERDAYMHYVNGGSGDCYQALDRHWPAATLQWARDIVWRESRNTPTAATDSGWGVWLGNEGRIGGVMAGFIEAVLRARGEWPYV